MKVSEVIESIKDYYYGINIDGTTIDEETTRDKVLFGDVNKKCTGIVTTCFASVEVIEDAINKKANLIICHEALFWNHGDKTDWLQDNKVYSRKKYLLESNGIVVWRNHDYIHSGMPLDEGVFSDGIFYGVMKSMGWTEYLDCDIRRPVKFKIPKCSSEDLAKHVKESLAIDGIRLIGDPKSMVETVYITGHVLGYNDEERIQKMDKEDIDAYIALELIDYTLSEYARDASQLQMSKSIIAPGHFNLEEVGMEYMLEYLPKIIGVGINVYYHQSGDTYHHY